MTIKTRRFILGCGLAALLCSVPATAPAGVAISITVAPPVLPVYVQPPCPAEGYLWTPGYWAWAPAGYYWVPGAWVRPPRVGVLWTPGYWGFVNGAYLWHAGYWGPHVGFYGGVHYGFGYAGVGFVGGVWSGGVFRYNTAVVNVNRTVVRNVYVDRTVIRNTTVVNRVSFNGPGGVMARPVAEERMAMREQHFEPTSEQVGHREAARMGSVNGRRYGQQQRIGQGVRSGQMTPGETARVERREEKINRQVREDRRANGGSLTPAERQRVNREQIGASREIYREKHNDRDAPR